MKLWIILLALILVGCSNTVQNTTSPLPSSVNSKQIFSAVLTDIEGDVTINGLPANDLANLQVDDTIQTADESEATIIFFNTSRTHLWDNTTIVIQRFQEDQPRNIQLKQSSGKIWTKLLRLSGVSKFEVITPTTVALVRGTGFWVSVNNGSTAIGVTEGKVYIQHINNNLVVGEKTLEKDQQIIIDNEMEVKPLVHDDFINENLQKDEEFINTVREKVGNENFDTMINSSSQTNLNRIDYPELSKNLNVV